MKNLLLLTIILLFSSCGKDYHVNVNNIMEVRVQHDLDAMYYFKDGGIIEVNEDQYGRISIYQVDYLTSVNPQNNTLGEHPKTNLRDKYLTSNNQIFVSLNVNYNGGDLEQDISGANITGTLRTDLEYEFKDDKLYLTIKIYQSAKFSNVNSIIAERTFVGVK